LLWFSLSLEFLDLLDKIDIAKVCRWKARCYLALFDLDRAKECLDLADDHDPDSLCTQYVRFLISLEKGNPEELRQLLVNQKTKKNIDYSAYLEVMADAAYKHGKFETALEALCILLKDSSLIQEPGKYGEIFQNWIRLTYSQFQKEMSVLVISDFVNQLGEVLAKMDTFGVHVVFGESSIPEGILEYVTHVSWNISLQLRKKKSWEEASALLEITGKFVKYRQESNETIEFHISTVLLHASCLMELIQTKKVKIPSVQWISC